MSSDYKVRENCHMQIVVCWSSSDEVLMISEDFFDVEKNKVSLGWHFAQAEYIDYSSKFLIKLALKLFCKIDSYY